MLLLLKILNDRTRLIFSSDKPLTMMQPESNIKITSTGVRTGPGEADDKPILWGVLADVARV